MNHRNKFRPRQVSNKIKTAGYFIKRLKDSGFVVFKMFNAYGEADSRRWTVLVDPGISSVYITCHQNKTQINEILFEFNDGGVKFPNGFYLKTESIETVIQQLIEKRVNNDPRNNPFSLLK